MEQRKYPRVQLPLLVRVNHPSFKGGHLDALARDVSAGGIFVHLQDHNLGVGAKLKLTLLKTNPLDAQATPTVDVVVRRITESGIGLEFINKTGQHLWTSVERIRDELAIGRDYFQIRQDVIVVNPDNALLVGQQGGKWSFPSAYLIVGEDWHEAIEKMLAHHFKISGAIHSDTVSIVSRTNAAIPEAAVFWLTHTFTLDHKDFTLNPKSGYRKAKWIVSGRDIEDLTFAEDAMRSLAVDVLEKLQSKIPGQN